MTDSTGSRVPTVNVALAMDVHTYSLPDTTAHSAWLLGHTSSVLSDMVSRRACGAIVAAAADVLAAQCMSQDGTLLITADRDEKIRVSHYPHCARIAAFCLGHTRCKRACVRCPAETLTHGGATAAGLCHAWWPCLSAHCSCSPLPGTAPCGCGTWCRARSWRWPTCPASATLAPSSPRSAWQVAARRAAVAVADAQRLVSHLPQVPSDVLDFSANIADMVMSPSGEMCAVAVKG